MGKVGGKCQKNKIYFRITQVRLLTFYQCRYQETMKTEKNYSHV